MKRFDLIKKEHSFRAGNRCAVITPNITEDTMFYLDGAPVGFYIKTVKGKLKDLLEIANAEFLSKRVPKQLLLRSDVMKIEKDNPGISHAGAKALGTVQYSTILGAIPPKAHMRRNYASISAVHQVASAKNFIKAMLLCCEEGEKEIKKIMPEQYEKQKNTIGQISSKYRFGELFTSSISNFNISAPYHRDTGNFHDTVNIILTKRKNATGGCLNVPDYGITVEQADNSMLVYPAWLNLHGVTPIVQTKPGGYRNSLIFYPLKGFLGID